MLVKRIVSLSILGLLAACGSADSESDSVAAGLDGAWAFDTGVTNGCADGFVLGMTFEGDVYTSQILCFTSDNSANMQLEAGNFVNDDGTLKFTPKESDCNDLTPYNYGYILSGNQLTVTYNRRVIIFDRLPPSDDSDPSGKLGFAINRMCF